MNVIILNGGLNVQHNYMSFSNEKPKKKLNTVSRTIGPYKISHWIKKHGYTCQVIDFCDILSKEQVINAVEKFIDSSTVIIAVSTTFMTEVVHSNNSSNRFLKNNIIEVIKEIKLNYPKIKYVVGGWHAEKITDTVFDASIMTYDNHSEDIFLEYLNYLIKDSPPPFRKISLERKNTIPWFNDAREKKYNIQTDNFKFTKEDCILENETLPLDVSRGCVFQCKYCTFLHLGKKKYDYVRDMNYLSDELQFNHENFNTNTYHILDDTFNDTVQKLEEFYSITEQLNFKINYSAYIRADLVHRFPESAFLLKDSGLFGSIFGIESLHPEASKIIGKAWSGKHAKDFVPKLVHDIWKNEIVVLNNIIIGLPKDTLENIQQTCDWFIDNNLGSMHYLPFYVTPPYDRFPGANLTGFDKELEQHGIKFEFDNNNNYIGWKHGEWTTEISKQVANKYAGILVNHSIAPPRIAVSLLSMGFTKEKILNTKRNKYNIEELTVINNNFIERYYNKLMNI